MGSEVIQAFTEASGLPFVDSNIVDRQDGPYLVLSIASPNDRFFELLERTLEALPETNIFRNRTTLRARKTIPRNRLDLPEVQLFRRVLSEISTISSRNFDPTRYVRSVTGAEEQITASSNHIVYGRRGSGKSTLLAYHLHELKQSSGKYAWFDMQVYSGSDNEAFIADVFEDLLQQLEPNLNEAEANEATRLRSNLTDIAFGERPFSEFIRLVPRVRRILGSLVSRVGKIVVFIDDIHVVASKLQPVLLGHLYSISRGNNVFLKISGIQQMTALWNAEERLGIETPHDAQVIHLDYNLTMPDRSRQHISHILDGHAKYCGLSSVQSICHKGVLDRLVFVSAGVPRDAINNFAQGISRALSKGQTLVSIGAINEAASLTLDEKLKNMQTDASQTYQEARETLARVREYCLEKKRTNAFLIRIDQDNPEYRSIEELVGLRMLHVIHEGFTPEEAGERFRALMLDFGFYVGTRAARSVVLFQTEPKRLLAKELRDLPRYS